jgi:hypothetical protein
MATNCDVKQNAISYFKKKDIVDDRLFINSPLFFIENDKLTDYAKQKYNLKTEGKLFDRTRIVFTDPNIKDKFKLVPNDELFKELQERYDEIESETEPFNENKLASINQELALKIQNKLQRLYPEISLNITNKPTWEEGDNVLNQQEYDNAVNFRLKVINGLLKLATSKEDKRTRKYGEVNEPQRLTIRLNTKERPNLETNIRKTLNNNGVTNDQVDFVFKYMKSNKIAEISTEDLINQLAANYSFTVDINTAKFLDENIGSYDRFYLGDDYYTKIDTYRVNGIPISKKKFDKAIDEYKKRIELSNTRYYANLTVPGGTNYTENEISTPNVKPVRKGHAQFATDYGIGWFRSDDKDATKIERRDLGTFEVGNDLYTQEFDAEKIETTFFKNGKQITQEEYSKANLKEPEFKTRRILEVQSDLFQKGRDSKLLTGDYRTKLKIGNKYLYKDSIVTLKNITEDEIYKYYEIIDDLGNKKTVKGNELSTLDEISKENQFLQLLNKDNNWVTFFVKSIIQDSAKKGYEKVLFPSGNTASKVEGQESLEEFKQLKESSIFQLQESNKEIKTAISNPKYDAASNRYYIPGRGISSYSSKDDFLKSLREQLDKNNKEIEQLKEELERVDREGFGALRPIFNFYENTVTNVLRKQGYAPNQVTDEYGNTWNEISINQNRDLKNILLQKDEANRIVGQANIKAMSVLIDAVNQKQDTLPHEYAHHYIAWFRNTPLVQEAIGKWGTEEALVQAIGEQAVEQKGESWNWWTSFVKWIQNLFDNISTKTREELKNILTDAFLQGVDLETGKIGISPERSIELAEKVDLAEALDDDFILNDDTFGDMIQDESEDGIEYQLTEDEPIVNTPPDMSIDEKIERFLQKIGVSVDTVQEIRDRNGRIIDANAKADMLNKIVEVVADRQLLDTLPEEAAHFFVNMLGTNNPLYKKMFDKITSYQMYARTVEVYKNNRDYRNADGTLNINKLKKEAIGKVIAQHIIGNEKGIESERNLGFLMDIWNQIWDFVKSFFVQVEDNPFETSAKAILEANVDELNTDFTENELYYQMNEPLTGLLADQENIKLDDTVDPRTGQKRHIYTYKGETAKGSVTTYYVDAWLKKLFRSDQRSQLQKMIDLVKADYGDVIHDQIRKIVQSWTNDDGTKRTVQKQVDKVVPSGPIYNLLNTYIQQLMNQYDANTKFFAEVKIFDQQKKIAGSIDLIVVKLNEFNEEVVDIYDWKSQEIFRDQEDIKPYKEPMYRIQLENYKKILEKQYGFKNFDKVRAIPIKTSFLYKDNQIYNIRSIEIGNVDPTKIPEDRSYLLPVTLKTESTGQEDLDTLIKKLNAIYSKLENFKYSKEERYKKREEINQLRLAIRDLQLKNKIDKFIAVGLTNYKKYNELLASEKLTGKEIFEALRILGVFAESSELLRDMREEYYQVLTEKGDKKELAKFEAINKNFGAMVSKVSGLIKAINRYQNEKVKAKSNEKGIKNILDAEAAVGSLPSWFQALSNINRTSFKLFSNLLRRAQTKRDIKYEDSLKKLKQLKVNYIKWTESKGLSVTQGINKILQLDEKGNWNGNFLNKYKKEFYTERDANIEKGNNKWLLENLEYDEEKYKQKEKEQIEFIKSVQYYLDEKENEEVIKKRIKEWINLHRVVDPNGKINVKALTNKQNGFLTPNEKWLTTQWNELQKPENKPLKEMYDYFQSLLDYSKKLGMLDGNVKGFIPSMNANKIDQFTFGSISDLFSKKGFFEDLEVDSGTLYTPQIDATDGSIVNKIPVYFTKDLGVKREDGTMDYSKKSRDIFKIFGLWAGHMYNYEQMQQLEDDAIMILNVERNKGMLVTDMFGGVVVENGVVQAVDKNDKNAQLLEDFMNYYLYDKQSDNLNDVKFKIRGKEYSLLKSVQSAMSFFSLKTLGLNPISGTANFVGGLGNILFTAEKGIMYTKKTWAEATYRLTSRDKKTWRALDYFSVLTEGRGTSLINDLSLSTLGGKYGLTKENAFIIQRIGDRGVEYPSAVALMLEHMIDGDKIVSIQQYVKDKYNYNQTFYNLPKSERDALKKKMNDEAGELKKTKSLLVVGQINKDGEFELPGITRDSETFAAFRDKIKGVAKKIIGNQSRDDINRIRTTMLGNAAMQFRNWIPELMEERFDGLKFDEELQTWTYGRANQFISDLISKRFPLLLKALITGLSEGNVIELAKQKYQDLKANALEKGQSFDISEGEFIDLYKGNLKALITEITVITGVAVTWTSITAGDDDKKTGITKYLSRALKKYYNEFAFYYNPKELTKIIDQPLPVIGLATDFLTFATDFGKEITAASVGNEEWQKEAKPLKYFNKMVPIGKEAMMWMAVFDDDFRKEWDIRIQ